MKQQLIEMRDRTEIYSVCSAPKEPKAHIHIVHGLAEHSGRYTEFIDYLVSEGYAVTAHDQRGHGETAVKNGHRYGYLGEHVSFDDLVDDTFEVIRHYNRQFPELPLILIGHSMGSFVVRRFIQLYGNQLDQVILLGTGSSPAVAGEFGKLLAEWRESRHQADQPDEMLNRLVFGSFAKQFPGESLFAWLSRDRETVCDYEEDPACGFIPTAQLFRILLEGMKSISYPALLENIPDELPILLLSGTEDPVGDHAKGVWRTARQFTDAGQQQVTVRLYEGGRHEMLQETNRHQVFKDIEDWIRGHE